MSKMLFCRRIVMFSIKIMKIKYTVKNVVYFLQKA